MKILMIGGTSFFGRLIVDGLLEAGHQLTLLTRGNAMPTANASHVQCDRTNYKKFKARLSSLEFDVVIDNLVSDDNDIKSIIDTFASRSNPPQYIFCSSVAVYNSWHNADAELQEDQASLKLESGSDWGAQYANGKRAAERYLAQHSGNMPYTIFRPTVIEGPGDPHARTWFWLQRILDGGPIIVSDSNKKTLYRHFAPADVANAFIAAVGNQAAYSQTFNVAGKDILSIEKYLSYLASSVNKNSVSICWLPEEIIAAELPEYMLPVFFDNVRLIPSINKIQTMLGYHPEATDSWLQATVAAFRDTQQPSLGYEHRQQELSLAAQHPANCEVLACD